ncbi:MAG: hypothetical protein WBD55_00075 [Dehalococcoidia bacterium]
MSLRTDLRRTWYDALRAAPVILVLALLPSTLYLDHWVEYLTATFLGFDIDAGSETEELTHTSHCHLGPGSCSDQPLTPNGRVIALIVEMSEPDLPTVLLETKASAPAEAFVIVPTEPPRTWRSFRTANQATF